MAIGGAAVNAGADFQQRLAALLMAHMLCEVPSISFLGIREDLEINEVRFETNDSIDDLVIETSHGRVFVQAKRSLNLSNLIGSEYSSVLKQFVAQFATSNEQHDRYVIATTSKASQKITKELKKLTEAMRLNETGGDENPKTQVELEVISKTQTLIESHYKAFTGVELLKAEFEKIFSRIYVATVEIEEGSALEHAVIILLAAKSNVSPDLIWGALISFCLTLAKDRLSIDKEGLNDRMGCFFSEDNHVNQATEVEEVLKMQFAGTISSGREVLLVENNYQGPDYLIMDLARFSDNGSKRLRFYEDKVELSDRNTFKVIHRTATYAGMERYLDKNIDKFKKENIALFSDTNEEDLDSKPFVRAYSERCERQARDSSNLLTCLHCGDPVSEHDCSFVEIDQADQNNRIGYVHSSCILPNDRVLGVIKSSLFERYKELKRFDYNLWYASASRGSALFNALSKLSVNVTPIAWKPDYERFARGKWCVKLNLEDGSARYAHDRGRVARYTREKAFEIAEYFSKQIDERRKAGDPWCYTSSDENFTSYSVAMEHMGGDVDIIKCATAEAVKYTKSIGEAYSKVDNFYAPLAHLLDEASGEAILLKNMHFLLTDPLVISRFIDNWRFAGFALRPFTVSIIVDDDHFDRFVRIAMTRKEAIVVDPIFNGSGSLVRGAPIVNFDELDHDESAPTP